MRLAEAAALVGGRVAGDGAVEVSGVAGLREAGPGDLAFLSRAIYAPLLASTRAAAVVAANEIPGARMPILVVKDPEAAMTRIAAAFAPPLPRPEPGVHRSASVDPTAALGEGVSVGPAAVVEAGARIGARTEIRAGASVGRGARVGADCRLDPGARVAEGVVLGDRVVIGANAVVGSDGFGFLPAGPGKVPMRVPQTGSVVVEDDVDIGAGACVARARFGKTVVGRGAKIDNLVQVAHNCRIGDGAIVAALTGLAGSTVVGEGSLLGGQVGTSGHIEIGAGARIAGQSGVTRDIPAGETWAGTAARPHREWQRETAALRMLPGLIERLRRLEKAAAEEE
jgi:UDP-3-O-[3-hydroxymyristoyl] glucosamine N-acyltransferase